MFFKKIVSSFICGRIQSKKRLPRAARQKGAGDLRWVRRRGRLKGDGILLCPSRKTLSPPDTQQKLSLPWRLAGNGLSASQSCSWVMHRASSERCGPVLCPSSPCSPLPGAVTSGTPGPVSFLPWVPPSLRQLWLLARCGATLLN